MLYVCVRERQRQIQRDRDREGDREKETLFMCLFPPAYHLCEAYGQIFLPFFIELCSYYSILSFIYSVYKSFLRHVIWKILSPVCRLSFHFLNSASQTEGLLIRCGAIHVFFFFYGLSICCQILETFGITQGYKGSFLCFLLEFFKFVYLNSQ